MADPTLDLALAFAQCVIAQDWAHAHSMCTGDLRACCAPEKLASEWQEVLAAVPGFVPNFARVNHWPKRIDQEEAAKLRFKTTPPFHAWRAFVYVGFTRQGPQDEGDPICGHVLVVEEWQRLAIAHADFEVFC